MTLPDPTLFGTDRPGIPPSRASMLENAALPRREAGSRLVGWVSTQRESTADRGIGSWWRAGWPALGRDPAYKANTRSHVTKNRDVDRKIPEPIPRSGHGRQVGTFQKINKLRLTTSPGRTRMPPASSDRPTQKPAIRIPWWRTNFPLRRSTRPVSDRSSFSPGIADGRCAADRSALPTCASGRGHGDVWSSHGAGQKSRGTVGFGSSG
jgi:hypothetical protein